VTPVLSLLPLTTPASGPVADVVTDEQGEEGAVGPAPATPTTIANNTNVLVTPARPAPGEGPYDSVLKMEHLRICTSPHILETLRVPHLKVLCKDRGLSTTGVKAVLLERLASGEGIPAKPD
jgi:hypothetical protein